MAFQQPMGEHLRGRTTVIAGAGVIGLSIARELVASVVKAGISHNIVVVEMSEKVASEASNECSGLISGYAVPRGCKQLLSLSINAWQDLASKKSMRDKLHYVQNGVVHTRLRYQPGSLLDARNNAQHPDDRPGEAPAWFNSREGETVTANLADFGRISTHRYIEWLKKECDELGVTFRFHKRVGFLHTLKDGSLQSIVLESTAPNENCQLTIPCNNLILACGPWTSGTLKDVLPDLDTDLDNFCQLYGWTHVKPDAFEERDNVGIQIRGARDEDSSQVAGDDRYGDITVATILSEKKNGDVFPTSAEGPKSSSHGMAKLTALAASRLKDFDETKVTHRGTSIISTSVQHRPLITKLPSELTKLPLVSTELPSKAVGHREVKNNESPLGVYLVCGFGNFGTTLASGAGIAVSRMVFGQDSGIAGDFEGYTFRPVRED